MQRDPFQLGAGPDQSASGQSIFKEHVATGYIGLFRDPSGNRAERISSVRDRHALCSDRAGHDSQRYSSSRRPAVFRVVFDPSVPIALVAAPGRGAPEGNA